MKRWSATTVALLLIGFVGFSYSHQASGQADANRKIVDGVAVADTGNGFLVSKNKLSILTGLIVGPIFGLNDACDCASLN